MFLSNRCEEKRGEGESRMKRKIILLVINHRMIFPRGRQMW